MKHRWLLALVALALSLVPTSSVAAPSQETIQVRLEPRATLIGGSVEVTVRVRCSPFGEHFESHITLQQEDNLIFGQRGLPVVQCDTTWHRYTVRITPFEGSFHRGRAVASAYVSRQDPETGDLREGSDGRTVFVR